MSEITENIETSTCAMSPQEELIQEIFEDFGFAIPRLPYNLADNLDLMLTEYLFANFHPEMSLLVPNDWADLAITYAEAKPETNLEAEPLELLADTLEETKDKILFGFTGHGMASWNFVYYYKSKHVHLHIFMPVLSPLNMQTQDQEDITIKMCYKVIDLCLHLEQTPSFFNESNLHQLCLVLSQEKMAFMFLDQNNIITTQINGLDEFFNYVENSLKILEQKNSSLQNWLAV